MVEVSHSRGSLHAGSPSTSSISASPSTSASASVSVEVEVNKQAAVLALRSASDSGAICDGLGRLPSMRDLLAGVRRQGNGGPLFAGRDQDARHVQDQDSRRNPDQDSRHNQDQDSHHNQNQDTRHHRDQDSCHNGDQDSHRNRDHDSHHRNRDLDSCRNRDQDGYYNPDLGGRHSRDQDSRHSRDQDSRHDRNQDIRRNREQDPRRSQDHDVRHHWDQENRHKQDQDTRRSLDQDISHNLDRNGHHNWEREQENRRKQDQDDRFPPPEDDLKLLQARIVAAARVGLRVSFGRNGGHCEACGRGGDGRILHRRRKHQTATPQNLCSSCILLCHKAFYCSLCFQVSNNSSPLGNPSLWLTCMNCHHHSHIECVRSLHPYVDLTSFICVDCIKEKDSAVEVDSTGRFASMRHSMSTLPPLKKLEMIAGSGEGHTLEQLASQLNLWLFTPETLAAAKMVAELALQEAKDAKERAKAMAIASAKATVKAKAALDAVFEAAQEETGDRADTVTQLITTSNPLKTSQSALAMHKRSPCLATDRTSAMTNVTTCLDSRSLPHAIIPCSLPTLASTQGGVTPEPLGNSYEKLASSSFSCLDVTRVSESFSSLLQQNIMGIRPHGAAVNKASSDFRLDSLPFHYPSIQSSSGNSISGRVGTSVPGLGDDGRTPITKNGKLSSDGHAGEAAEFSGL